MYQLYLWFCKERGYIIVRESGRRFEEVRGDRKEKCEEFRKENEWRVKLMNRK